MKKILFSLVLFLSLQASAQSDWKQILRYDLHVKFNPDEKSLDAVMKLQYVNHSPDTLSFIWFHVWPNAYRNDRTLYTEQLLENGDTRFYFSSKEQKGWLNRLDFRVNGILAGIQDHPEYIDVVKLILPGKLVPGDSISVSVSFHLRLPFNFNGTGYRAHHFELRNWYPEPAVYDAHGWHPMPFLVQGGAYHEAADYHVEIESPPSYCIAAGAAADTLLKSDRLNTYQFSIKNANAFAWAADDHYLLKTDTMNISPDRQITLQYFYTKDLHTKKNDLFAAAKIDIRRLSEWLSPYPHQTISLVQSTPEEDQNFSGMACIGISGNPDELLAALRKALLGQWFQTILLTDQRDSPWLSKGFVNYYNQRLIYDSSSSYYGRRPFSNHNLWLRVAENEKTTQPISTAAPEFSTQNDSLIPGTKAGIWLARLRDSIGDKRFDGNMLDYFSNWRFRHPYPADFKAAMDSGTTKNLQPIFNKLTDRASLFADSKRKLKPAFIFSAANSARYNYIGLAPVPGYNRYDGFMLGAAIHNINLPENKFEFLFTPLYAFDSKKTGGSGKNQLFLASG